MTPGLSLSMKMSSSMSPGPKVQVLLVGTDISFTLSMTGATKYEITLKINLYVQRYIGIQ